MYREYEEMLTRYLCRKANFTFIFLRYDFEGNVYGLVEIHFATACRHQRRRASLTSQHVRPAELWSRSSGY